MSHEQRRPSPGAHRVEVREGGKNGNRPPPPASMERLLEAVLVLSNRFTMLEEHLLETRHLMKVATYPSRLPLWFIAGALSVIAVALSTLVVHFILRK